MISYGAEKVLKQRVVRQSKKHANQTQWREVEIIDTDHRPSWKRYAAKGVANLKVNAVIDRDGVAVLEVTVSETALADELLGDKRDVTKQAFFTAYGPAAFEIYEVLREAFEPKLEDK